jgi:hypothetical protein
MLFRVIAVREDLGPPHAVRCYPIADCRRWHGLAFTLVVSLTTTGIVWIAIKSRLVMPLDPRHLDIADVIIAVVGIELEHGILSPSATRPRLEVSWPASRFAGSSGGRSELLDSPE